MAKAKNTLSDADIDQLEQVLTETPEGRRWLAEKSWKFFAKYYMGIDIRSHQIRWLEHLENKARAGVLGPVGHGKTYAVARVFALKKILYNRNIRILMVSAVERHAKKNVRVLSEYLRKNVRIKEDFGEFYSHENDWTKTSLIVIRDQILTDPTVEAVGIDGDITGGRFDLIILDDMVTDKNSRTEAPRKTVEDYFDSTVSKRIEKGGSIIFIGTRYHYADKYGKFIRQRVIWDILVDKAIIREPERYEFIELDEPFIDEDGNNQRYKVQVEGDPGECLDPINRPMEYLLLERHANSRMFELVYQNNATSDDSVIFKLQWFEKCKRADLSYEQVNYIIAGKTVTPRGEPTFDRSKYMAIVVGTDPAIAA
jgi:hypothetical protein